MDARRIKRLGELEEAVTGRVDDPWKAAWEAADLAAAVERDMREAGRGPSTEDLATLWFVLTLAEACERRLAEDGRTSADDRGETVPTRVRGHLDRLANKVLWAAEDRRGE